MNRHDPRIRQTINRFTDTLETANLNTQASLWTFSEAYVQPCLKSVSSCLEASCYPCIGAQRERIRARQRHLNRNGARGRPELVFDFYNDEWDEEETERTGLLGSWGTDELDRLLAGSGSDQPRRHGPMNYGTRGVKTRRKSIGTKGGEMDPTIVPGSSMFGFLERLPWKIGGRGVRYKPSAADLQENPGRKGAEAIIEEEEGEPLLDDSDNGPETDMYQSRHQRKRSGTVGSRSTSNSYSSRGDLFPSEDEDDAVPLDDEFAMTLARRNTDDRASGKSRGKRNVSSRTTSSSKETRSIRSTRSKSTRGKKTPLSPASSRHLSDADATAQILDEEDLPTMEDLKREEARVREEDEAEVERKRREARQVAVRRGLATEEDYDDDPLPNSDGDMTLPEEEEEEGEEEGKEPPEEENEDLPPSSPQTTDNDYDVSLRSPDSTKSFGERM